MPGLADVPITSGVDSADYGIVIKDGGVRRADPTEMRNLIGTASTLADGVVRLAGSSATLPYVDAKWYGLGDGTDPATAIQNAADATADGGVLRIRGGAYNLGTQILVSGKSITVDARGAVFTRTADVISFYFVGGYDTAIAVSAVAENASYASDDVTQTVTQLTLASSPTWAKGDIVKLFADDVIPGARPGSAGNEERVGSYLTVAEVSGTTVYCYGRVLDTPATNIKVARLPVRTARLRGGRFITASSVMTAGTAAVVTFRGLVDPQIDGTQIDSSPSAAIAFSGCYGYSADNVRVGYAKTASASSQYGYGILDQASAFGQIDGLRARRVRHAFTDSTPAIAAGTTDPTSYGRTFATEVTNGVCHAPSSYAWDTHHSSEAVKFTNCRTFDGFGGVGLRGRRHHVIDSAAIRCQNHGLVVFEETAGGDSTGHYVKDWLADRCPVGFAVDVRPTGHPSAGVRHTTNTVTADGVTILGSKGYAVSFKNAKAIIDNVKIVADSGTLDLNGRSISITNSEVYGRGWVQDYRAVSSSAANNALCYLASTSILDVDGWEWWSFNAGATATAHAILTDGATTGAVIVRKMRLERAPATAVVSNLADLPDDSSVDYVNTATGANSAALNVSDANIASASYVPLTLGRTREPVATFFLLPSTGAQTLPAFKDGLLLGQRVHLQNTSGANTVTIPHGDATYNTTLDGGVDRVIATKGTVTLTWTGSTWID